MILFFQFLFYISTLLFGIFNDINSAYYFLNVFLDILSSCLCVVEVVSVIFPSHYIF